MVYFVKRFTIAIAHKFTVFPPYETFNNKANGLICMITAYPFLEISG